VTHAITTQTETSPGAWPANLGLVALARGSATESPAQPLQPLQPILQHRPILLQDRWPDLDAVIGRDRDEEVVESGVVQLAEDSPFDTRGSRSSALSGTMWAASSSSACRNRHIAHWLR
jgi:hypothetical protein